LLHTLTAAVAFLLLASGSGKLLKPASTEAFLRAFNTPRGAARPLTILVSLLEVALGVLMLFDVAVPVASIATAALGAVFLGTHLMARANGGDISCQCFGAVDTKLPGSISLGRSASFFALSTVAAVSAALGGAAESRDQAYLTAVVFGLLGALTFMLIFQLLGESRKLVEHDAQVHARLIANVAELTARTGTAGDRITQ